jgi:hypothetical protein
LIHMAQDRACGECSSECVGSTVRSHVYLVDDSKFKLLEYKRVPFKTQSLV